MAATNKTRTPARRSGGAGKAPKKTPATVISMAPVHVAGKGVQWVRRKPQERSPHVVAAGVYASGVVTSQLGVSPLYIMLGTVTAAGIGYVATIKKSGDEQIAGLGAAAIVASGSWIAAAAEFGVLWGHLWGPLHMATLAFLLSYLVLYRRYSGSDKMTEQVKDRDDQIWWVQARDSWKLPNSNLISLTDTRLGEKYVINIMGTGKRASSFCNSGMEEHIAAIHKLPRSRVKVREGKSADRVVVYIRFTDPWAQPITHPLLDSDPEILLPDDPSIVNPVIIGQDPETGKPLTIETVDPEEGANRVMVVGMSGAGKTVLVNSLLERLTACRDAMVCCIDLSKGKEMRRFRNKGALGPSALGPNERIKALRILQMAVKAIQHRSEQSEITDDVVHTPRPGSPAIVLVLDEVDALFERGDNIARQSAACLSYLLSKGRSEMVTTIMIGQRGTAKWMGGANVRANFNVHVILKVQRQGEMRLAMGEFASHVPDMSKYGEGHKGVAIVAKDDGWQAGRTFLLRQLTDLDRLAEGRRASDIEPSLAKALGSLWTKLTSGEFDAARQAAAAERGGPEADLPTGDDEMLKEFTGQAADDEDADEAAEEFAAEEMGLDTAPGDPAAAAVDSLEALDAEMEATLPEDLQAQKLEETMNRANKRLDDARHVIESRQEVTKPTPEEQARLADSTRLRWEQVAAQTEISAEHMAKIMELVRRPTGASSAEISKATGIPKTSMWRVLQKLQFEGIAHRRPPKGRNARIYAGPAPGTDAQAAAG